MVIERLLGDYGARLNEIEDKVDMIQKTLDAMRIDQAEKKGENRVERRVLVTAGGFVGALAAFLGNWVKEWLTRN